MSEQQLKPIRSTVGDDEAEEGANKQRVLREVALLLARHEIRNLRRWFEEFDRDIVRWVTLLVREHLTLSEFATGRNPNDPNVGDDLAGRLDHNPVLLDMLFDLTRADGSSLGATSGETISKQYGWSKWRETLVRTMYNATRYHM